MTKYMNISDRLRRLLLEHPEGMTIKDLSEADGSPQETIISALYRNYGFYIGDWEKIDNHKLRAVWMVVRVPDRAPKPTGYDDLTEQEAKLQRKRIENRRRQLEEREHLHALRVKLKKQRDEERRLEAERKLKVREDRLLRREQERVERQIRRDQIRAEKEAKAARAAGAANPKPYVPEKTFWQPVPPWPNDVIIV